MKEGNRGLRILWILLGAVFFLVLLAFLWLSLIISQPRTQEEKEIPAQPLAAAGSSLSVSSETDLRDLIAAFPAPVMSFMSGSGTDFVSGTSEDRAYGAGFARIVTLYWQTSDGQPLILQSIYPSSALELMGKKDYAFSDRAGPTLAGQSSVRMENADTVRIHAAIGPALYVITAPKALSDSLSALSRSMQLFTAD